MSQETLGHIATPDYNEGGFVFPIIEKVKEIGRTDRLRVDAESSHTISRLDLFKSILAAVEKAWLQGIKPLLSEIRNDPMGSSTAKGAGQDFFTRADTTSEKIIKQYLTEEFGIDSLRIFAEETNDYTGNLNSNITLRIDPIDGTETFKQGKPDWGIMVGAYSGPPGQEHLEVAVVYYPEYNEILYSVDGKETFLTEIRKNKHELVTILPQQTAEGIIVSYWQHPDPQRRGNLPAILSGLASLGTLNRQMNSSAGDIREAMLSHGKWIIITEGGNQVDFIPYSLLVQLGYKIYEWTGSECNPDNPEIAQKKIIVVPPGAAGDKILETLKILS